jgi:UDP-N-acetylmuramoylalanine--D-glutamate ligase
VLVVVQKNGKVVVLGLGVSGRSTIRFLLTQGRKIVGVDDSLSIDKELQEFVDRGVEFSDSTLPQLLDDVEFLVKSPGVPETHGLVIKAKGSSIPVIGDIELVTGMLGNLPCIGVTGTNGKTTVSLLIEHILQCSGKNVKVCGNVGVPITDVVMGSTCDGLVIELSSYQLETLKTPFLDVAVILNITPDHLDRYASFEKYRQAKLKIFSLLNSDGVAIAHDSVSVDNGDRLAHYGSHETLPAAVLDVFRLHDLDNIEAAFMVCRKLGLSDDQLLDGLFSFKKPPHRIEFVSSVRGVSYYNDSKGTNVDAVKKAVDVMDGNVVLIAGGVDKGSSYASWKDCFSGKVKMICAIGEAASKLEKQLGSELTIRTFGELDQAIAHAVEVSAPGDNILLSPGCASFDMFRNYQHRGDEFKRIVRLITVGE